VLLSASGPSRLFLHPSNCILPLPYQRRGQQSGRSWELIEVARVSGTLTLLFFFSFLSSLSTVGEALPLPQVKNPSPEIVDKYHALYMDALYKLFEQHKVQYGCSNTQKLIFL
jgi:hypothetical protein